MTAMLVDPAPQSRAAAPVVILRWDLDKTYLRSDFERLGELIRVPFQKAADKTSVPGVAELIRSLQEFALRGRRRALVYFVSASPPQLGKSIREKLALDGVEADGIVFKDQLHILLRGKFRGLREQIGFKLTELLRGRLSAPDEAPEYLFGDDWETDPVIYSLYADIVAGRVGGGELERILAAARVDREWREEIEKLLPEIHRAEAVRRIFINLERRKPVGSFRPFGPRLIPAFNYFQTAACLYEDGQIAADGVERVGRALIDRDGYTREMLENSLEDVWRRGHLGGRARDELADELRRRGLLPERRIGMRARWKARARRWWRRRPPVALKQTEESVDYGAILRSWRADR